MGSSGMKKRRKGGGKGGSHPQHLPKVGTSHDAAAHEQALERSAIADTMGLGNTPPWLRWGCLVIGALVLVGGVVSLIALD